MAPLEPQKKASETGFSDSEMGSASDAVSQTVPAPASGSAPVGPLVAVSSDSSGLTKQCSTCQTHYPADFLVCPRDATPLLDLAVQEDPLLGMLLGETYQIVRLVGEGGMGRVYEARHLRLRDRRFAVKVLHAELARQPEVVARFQREAESASAIEHENVVDVFDVHRTPDGRPYLVGEFLEGVELGEHLAQREKLATGEAVNITRQVCHALAAAHARGIVHRDVKPENVFVLARARADEGGRRPFVKVIDFGISKATARGGTHLTRTGMIMGTPSYMAPEQARGEKVDLRADVYAVGALLYHLTTGHKPFDSDDPAAILSQVLTEEPPRPCALEPSVPEALEVIIQRAMAKDARDRFPSMDALDAALAPFDPGASALAAPFAAVGAPLAGGPVRSADTTARTMMAATAPATTSAKMARPTVVALGAAMASWFTFGFVDALAGVVRWSHARELEATESVLLVLGGVLAAATPAVLFGLHVKKVVWPNSVRAIALAGDLRRIALAALVTYGAVAFGARVAFGVFLRDSRQFAAGSWDASLFAASVVGAALAYAGGVLARRGERGKGL